MTRIVTVGWFTLLLAAPNLPAVNATEGPVEFTVQRLHGGETSLNEFRGKWLVLNYWATWCRPCIVEMPELESFHDENVDNNAMVVGINAENISQQRLQTFLDDYFITYPIFVSGPTQQSELGLSPGLPTTFLVTPEGEVVARQGGPVTREMIEQFIQKWQP